MKKIIGTGLVALCVLSRSSDVRVAADTGIGFWTFEDVAAVNVIPQCGPGVTVTGFRFDPTDRPIVGWNLNDGCGGRGGVKWASRDAGVWNVRDFNPHLLYLGGGTSDSQHRLGIAPDGHPWMMFRAVDATTGDNNVFTWLTDLATAPHGELNVRKEFLIGPQNCSDGWHYLEFAPGATAPSWLTTQNLCSPFAGAMWLDGGQFTGGIVFTGADYAVGRDGHRHVVRAATSVSYSQDGGPWATIPDLSRIDATTGQPAALEINRFSGDVQIVVDPSNTIHVFARGYDSHADYDLGTIVHLSSSDGGATWTAPETIDSTHTASTVTAALDRNGALALVFWRFGQLWYATHASGQWEFSEVTDLPYSDAVAGDRQVELAFDSTNTPAIAFFDWNYTLDVIVGKVRLAHPAPAGATPPPVDLQATIDATPKLSALSGQITLTVAASNRSAVNTSNVDVAVTLPAGVQVVTTNPGANTIGDTVHFTFGSITSGATATATVVVTAQLPATDTATATVTGAGPDPDPSNNSAATTFSFLADSCFTPRAGITRWQRGEGNFTDTITGIGQTPSGGVTFTQGVWGQAFALDGTSGFIPTFTWDDGPEYPNDGSFTLDAWIKTTIPGGLIGYRNECQDPNFCAPVFYYLAMGDGHLGAAMRDSDAHVLSVPGTTLVNDGRFHHVALVLDRPQGPHTGEMRVYVDGVVDGRVDASSLGYVGDNNGLRNTLSIGGGLKCCGPTPFGFFAGSIDEFAIHTRALSDAELLQVATAPSSTACGANAAPAIVNPGAQTTAEGTAVTLQVSATDADNDPLTFTATGLPPGLSISTAGSIAGTPPFDASGVYNVTVTVSDGSASVSASFTWTITNTNRAPAGQADSYSATEDTPSSIAAPGVLGNDGDPDGDALTAKLVSGPSHGTLALAADGSFTYTPTADYNGADSFTYAPSDGAADGAAATVSINVAAVNDPPSLAPVNDVTVNSGTRVSFALSASDPDGDTLAFSATGIPTGASLSAGGAFAWTPTDGDAGPHPITFTVTDPGGLSASRQARITVDVPPPPPSRNQAPVCSGARPRLPLLWPPDHKKTFVIDILGVTDADNDPLQMTVKRILQDEPTDTEGDGTTAIDGGGVATAHAWVRAERTGTPKVPGNGRFYEIQFTAEDGRGGSCSGMVFVTVPHDRNKPAVDDGVRYDSTVANGARIR